METTQHTIFWIMLLAIISTSCVKVDLVDPDAPLATGKVTLVTDWSVHSAGIDVKGDHMLEINDKALMYTEATHLLPPFTAGTYVVCIHNIADKVSMDNTIATVQATNGVVENNPNWLFSKRIPVTYVPNEDKVYTAVMEQQIRQLTIELTILGNAANITSMTGKLSGIAHQWNIDSNEEEGNPVNIIPVFEKKDNKLTAVVRMIGIRHEVAQLLTLNINLSNGSTKTIEEDVSAELIKFNTDKYLPMSLTAKLTESNFSATIKEWKSDVGNNVIAQ